MPAVRAMPIRRRVTVVFIEILLEPVRGEPSLSSRADVLLREKQAAIAPPKHARPVAGAAQLAIGLISARPGRRALLRRDDLADLGAKEKELADEWHPQHHDEDRPQRAIRADVAAQIDAVEGEDLDSEEPTDGAQQRGWPHLTKAQPDRRQKLEQRRKGQERDDDRNAHGDQSIHTGA